MTRGAWSDPLASLSQRIDYLQCRWLSPELLRAASTFTAPSSAESWRLSRVDGVGASPPPEPGGRTEASQDGRRWQPPSSDLLAGLHGVTSLAFQVAHLDGRLRIQIGAWSQRATGAEVGNRHRVLTALLRGCYSGVRLAPGEFSVEPLDFGGYVVGVPQVAPPRADSGVPWDRLVRALKHERWAVHILAQPVAAPGRDRLRDALLAESRAVREAAGQELANAAHGGGNPLVAVYLEQLAAAMRSVTEAQSVGSWRTAVYLLGDASGYRHLAAAWKGIFSGLESHPQPVTVVSTDEVLGLARSWVLPDAEGPPGPGMFHYPFGAQTVLTSWQLANYVHLPRQEHPGFFVEQQPSFDLASRAGTDRAVTLGTVLDSREWASTDPGAGDTHTNFAVSADALKTHAFVCGVTGAGKTNTVLTLLGEAATRGASFLVLEPAKKEYRSLLSVPGLGDRLRVFTVGDETTAPLRLNPLEVPAGIPIAAHLDLFRALFAAAYALWSPLPQVLERAMLLAYRDRGWDINSNTNPRLDDPRHRAAAFPTLADLENRVEDVIRSTGYDPEAMARLRGKLGAHLAGLQVGGKGAMFAAGQATPDEELFDRPVVLELESLGDEEDKAFVMGLVLIRLAEHRRVQGPTKTLRHLLVVEEAHRLLSSRPKVKDADFGDAAGQAIETFTNLLAEVRAYGQGLVIADQVPSRLAPEVIKNTNLKIVHRLLAADDRHAVASTMAMTEAQSRSLTTLVRGQAAVFAEGEDAPLLILVSKAPTGSGQVQDAQLRRYVTAKWGSASAQRGCCGSAAPAVCDQAREAAAAVSFQMLIARVATTTATTPSVAVRMRADVLIAINALLPSALRSDAVATGHTCMLWRAARHLARRRAAQRSWTYTEAESYADALSDVLTASMTQTTEATLTAANRFAQLSSRLFRRDVEPFPGCATICPNATCLFRWPLEEVLSQPDIVDRFRTLLAANFEDVRPAVDQLADDVALSITALPRVDWSEADIDQGWRAAIAANKCATQLMMATQGRPSSSPDAEIRSFLAPSTDMPAGEDEVT
jgi:hypothetical protein